MLAPPNVEVQCSFSRVQCNSLHVPKGPVTNLNYGHKITTPQGYLISPRKRSEELQCAIRCPPKGPQHKGRFSPRQVCSANHISKRTKGTPSPMGGQHRGTAEPFKLAQHLLSLLSIRFVPRHFAS